MPSRRAVLASATLAGVAALGRPARAAGEPGLGAVATASGRFFGSAVRFAQLASDPAYAELIARECTTVSPEVELKWAAVAPQRGALALAPVDDLARFARDHRLRIYGHTLLWHRSIPDWATPALLAGDWTPIRLHFASVLPRLGDVIDYWDVVNEPIETGFRDDGLRPSPFLQGFGPDYVGRALETARAFQPQGRLMLNEYGLEYATEVEDARRYHLLRLVERLRSAGAPLDGVGLQAHLDLRKGPVATDRIAAFVGELAQMGLRIVVSELDVREADYTADPAARDRAVADETRRYLDTVLAEPAVAGVSTWGLSDRYSWLDVTADDLAGYRNAWTDGTGPGVNRGLPWDSDLRPKPMRAAIAAALSAPR